MFCKQIQFKTKVSITINKSIFIDYLHFKNKNNNNWGIAMYRRIRLDVYGTEMCRKLASKQVNNWENSPVFFLDFFVIIIAN